IELPFLQRVLPGEWRLLPVMVGDQRREVARALGLALARALRGRAALLVASTDLSHYHPQAVANRLDRELLRRVEAFDLDALLRAGDEGAGEACGIGALAAVLWAARELGADRVRVLDYATSGDVTGDMGRVVGYAAGGVTARCAGTTTGGLWSRRATSPASSSTPWRRSRSSTLTRARAPCPSGCSDAIITVGTAFRVTRQCSRPPAPCPSGRSSKPRRT